MTLIVTSHKHVISCAVVLPIFVKHTCIAKLAFTFNTLTFNIYSLGQNNIGDDGAKCISEGLKYCPQLHILM